MFIPIKDFIKDNNANVLSLYSCPSYPYYLNNIRKFKLERRITEHQFQIMEKFPTIAQRAHIFINKGVKYVEIRKDWMTPYFHHPVELEETLTGDLNVSDPLANALCPIHDHLESLYSFGIKILGLEQKQAYEYALIEADKFIIKNFPERIFEKNEINNEVGFTNNRNFREDLKNILIRISHNPLDAKDWKKYLDKIWREDEPFFGSLMAVKSCDTPRNSLDPENLNLNSNLYKLQQNLFNSQKSKDLSEPWNAKTIEESEWQVDPYYTRLHYPQGFRKEIRRIAKEGVDSILSHYLDIFEQYKIMPKTISSEDKLEWTREKMEELAPQFIQLSEDSGLSLGELEQLALEWNRFDINRLRKHIERHISLPQL
jgi:hypothetical protein